MRRSIIRSLPQCRSAATAVIALASAVLGHAQQGAPNGAWPTYGGHAGSSKYAPLDQIDADNVEQLGRCARGFSIDRSGEMVHVWLLDHPDGSFATGMSLPPETIEALAEKPD